METRELTNEEYHSTPGYLNSSLLKAFSKSVAHGKAYINKEFKTTPAMEFGTLWHSVMEGKTFKLFNPPINYKTDEAYDKTSKVYLDAWHYQSRNCNLIAKDDFEKIQAMQANFEKDYSLLQKGITAREVSIFAEVGEIHDEFGFKIRLDAMSDAHSFLIDYKTTSVDDLTKIKYDFAKYDYDLQMYLYKLVADTFYSKDFEFIFIFTQTVSPYESLAITAENMLNSGFVKFKKGIENYKKYLNNESPATAQRFSCNNNLNIINLEDL